MFIHPCDGGLSGSGTIGQKSHVRLALRSQAFTSVEMLTVHGRALRGLFAAGIVIDDVLLMEQVPAALVSTAETESVRRLRRLVEEYIQEGWI